MSAQESVERTSRPARATHLYAVGEAVRLKAGYMRPFGAGDTYRIIRTLPSSGGMPQYRIQSDDEGHERVITQDNIEPAGASSCGEGASLLQKTFGRG